MPSSTHKFILSNGLTVLLHEDHHAPVVSMNMIVKTGSASETRAEAGISHLIEHMLFKGTKKRGVGEIAREVEAAGGEINAYTSFDETVFYINMASQFADTGLDILADAALNSQFDAAELAREKEVVVEEISRYEDLPSARASDELFTAAYKKHPYHYPIIGTRESVRRMTRQQIFHFLKKWYVAKNMVFVATGDFKTGEFFKKIEKAFAPLRGESPSHVYKAGELPQKSGRSIAIPMPIEGSYIHLGFHIPEVTHEEIPSLEVAGHILGGGEHARLVQEIQEKKQLVTSIGAYPYTPQEPGLFIVSAALKVKNLKAVIQATFYEIAKLAKDGASESELAKAKLNIESDVLYSRETMEGMARKLGFYETHFGDYQKEREYQQKVNAITTEQIQAVVKKYLNPQQATMALAHPQKNSFSKNTLTALLKPREPMTRKRSKIQNRPQAFTLSNGIRLIVKENHATPLVSIRASFKGGLRAENRTYNGMSHLIADSLTKGTTHRTAQEIAYEIESMAGSLSGSATRNLMGLRATFLTSKLQEGVTLFADVLLNPSFPKKELERERKQTLEMLRQEQDNLSQLAYKNFMAALYPTHPYGWPILGTRKSLRRMTPKALLSFYRSLLTPKNLCIGISGDVDAFAIRNLLEEKLGNLSRRKGPKTISRVTKAPQGILTKKVKKKRFQGHIMIGFLGGTLRDKNHLALVVLDQVLSGQGGRLFVELRDKQSLAYTVTARHEEGLDRGYFLVYIGTDGAKIPTATSAILTELHKIRNHKITASELERAKRHILGTHALDQQNNATVADSLASYEAMGLDFEEHLKFPERIKTITREDVLRVAQKYLTLDSYVLSMVHP